MTQDKKSPAKPNEKQSNPQLSDVALPQDVVQPEFGGRKGPEATRYGDWEMNGKCVDF